MMSKLQLAMLHMGWKQAGLNEEQYRTILRTVCGVESSKQLGQVDFENVMAVLEDSGFCEKGQPPDKWRMKVQLRGSFCGERLEHKIGELAPLQRYPLPALCRQFSGGRTEHVRSLRPREAWKLVEMLKAAAAREAS